MKKNGGELDEAVTQWIRSEVENRKAMQPVVEYGCLRKGGAVAREMFPEAHFFGGDVSEGPGVDIIDNMESSRFDTGTIGTVLYLDGLERVGHPWKALAEAYRILKPGGELFVSAPINIPISELAGDYWRMSSHGLELLLRDAGFQQIEVYGSDEVKSDSDRDQVEESGDQLSPPQGFTHGSFAIAKKAEDAAVETPRPLEQRPRTALRRNRSRDRDSVPIIVAVYHREEDTRRMFKQLARVTDNYELIIVSNGFDDKKFLRKLKPVYYTENETNTGAIRPINQGLEVAKGEYVAVLHNDLLIYDEGWLDHIIEFMERRGDVGLVGLAGRHSINSDGSLDLETTVVDMRWYPESFRPSWRLTEVATIDGLGWVMRNTGLRLDERFGMMHFYDLDLSLQYIDAGYKVYSAAVEVEHLAEIKDRSTRDRFDYLRRIGGDDEAYYEEVQEMFRKKWEHLLPITRGFQDEAYAYYRIGDLEEHREGLEEDNRLKQREIDKASAHIEKIEREIQAKNEEMRRMYEHILKLEKMLSAESTAHDRHHRRDRKKEDALKNPPNPESSMTEKIRFYLKTEGLSGVVRRAISSLKRRV